MVLDKCISSAVSTCDTIQKTVSIVSSDCFTPLSDVTIKSQQPISVRSLAAGSYELGLCSLPVIVSLAKPGFKSITVKLTASSNTIPLPCLGKILHPCVYSLDNRLKFRTLQLAVLRSFNTLKNKMGTLANSEGPDEMSHDAAFHLSLHSLLKL